MEKIEKLEHFYSGDKQEDLRVAILPYNTELQVQTRYSILKYPTKKKPKNLILLGYPSDLTAMQIVGNRNYKRMFF